ncbi:MAG TPA: hypothetical protein VKQ36_02290 [Ktedonobacterales bacterium]|nr:hypothetical protein [Ktedonobacterales bacterium]
MPDPSEIAHSLRHVLWIGGSPGAGKSTVSHAIARVYVFLDYHCDAWARNHFARRVAAGEAEVTAFLKMSMDERWIQRSVEELTREAITSWTRDFSLVIEDLLAAPGENFIVAEGNFFPECVAPYLTHPHQAIWLTPTDAFCEQARRHKQAELARRKQRHGVNDEGSDPEQRLRSLIARDQQLARYVKAQVEALHLPCIEVDGSLSPEELTERVERHLDPYLIERLRALR